MMIEYWGWVVIVYLHLKSLELLKDEQIGPTHIAMPC